MFKYVKGVLTLSVLCNFSYGAEIVESELDVVTQLQREITTLEEACSRLDFSATAPSASTGIAPNFQFKNLKIIPAGDLEDKKKRLAKLLAEQANS